MSDANLKFFIFNNNVYPVEEFDNLYVEDSSSLYEVLRVNESVPLFLEEHYERLISSGKIIGHNISLSFDELKSQIQLITQKNNVVNHNIKIVINNLHNEVPNIYYFFIKTNYPDASLYEEGVKTFLYSAERDNPNAKIINTNLRNTINTLLEEKNCYEAILVNSDGYITEGSRSNLFFIKDNTLYTTEGKDVLLGITRKRIIELARSNEINTIEKPIHIDELKDFSSLFISGTSPKVLPINAVDSLKYSTKDSLLLKIMKIYDNEINSYISSHK
ncbi:aminotransferase class IV [Clostridium cylindrosporum]|uniref:Aminotransferase, class IV n=1 Tax=Clostridium cylindrosporum DSM 605 TaxID=1121307 RepID=A0A0J8DAG8_CLOCY|nr:aminotransferase class IV [Clostridium cylindrosporum]KMT21319.1 aminotransferase, class IV [Clostridium cylindrosporum DSM 605]